MWEEYRPSRCRRASSAWLGGWIAVAHGVVLAALKQCRAGDGHGYLPVSPWWDLGLGNWLRTF
jgi:hypothetical protein